MTPKPIAYVQAHWHTEITDHCKEAFLAELAARGHAADAVEFFSTPGGLYRHEFVAEAVLQGIVDTLDAVAALA